MRKSNSYLLFLGILLIFLPEILIADNAINLKVADKIKKGVDKFVDNPGDGFTFKELNKTLENAYNERSNIPFWLNEKELLPQAYLLKKIIENTWQHGLMPEDYFMKSINQRWGSAEIDKLSELELILSLAAVKLSEHAQIGRIKLRKIDSALFNTKEVARPDLFITLKEVFNSKDIYKYLEDKFPRHRQYQRMREALIKYTALKQSGGWQLFNGIKSIDIRSKGIIVQNLATRLYLMGDLPDVKYIKDHFDPEMITAVKTFQLRHGLPTTGEVGPLTLAALNIPIESRIRTLSINLERWRWLARDFTENKEIYINIAGFELFALEKANILLRMPVIVGKAYQATPVFSGMIKHIEVNPYWNVPFSIAANEMLPKLQKNRSYLSDNNMLLYKVNKHSLHETTAESLDWDSVSPSDMRHYAIKQRPGKGNVLGSLKFSFPNPYSVYLHDTSNPELFKKYDRALSHGCIRISDPKALAVYLLDQPNDKWTTERITGLINEGKNKFIMLSQPVRIHLTYRTAWVDLDNNINFRQDIYKRDKKLERYIF